MRDTVRLAPAYKWPTHIVVDPKWNVKGVPRPAPVGLAPHFGPYLIGWRLTIEPMEHDDAIRVG